MADRPEPFDDNLDWTDVATARLDTALQLQSVRARLGMSQPDLALLLRIPVSTLRNWEQGRTTPDAFARRMIRVIYDEPELMRDRLDRASAA